MIGVTSVGVYSLGERRELAVDRVELSAFPLEVDDWLASENFLPPEIEDVLKVDDYLLADYTRSSDEQVNFYIAYYVSQRKGSSPHSPRVCLPGGGWRISEIGEVQFTPAGDDAFPVNRAVMELDSRKQLVYYWFEQRGRRIANEYWMKWYLLTDSLSLNRTDGSLVRVVTPILPSEKDEDAERRLNDFLADIDGMLNDYVPN